MLFCWLVPPTGVCGAGWAGGPLDPLLLLLPLAGAFSQLQKFGIH